MLTATDRDRLNAATEAARARMRTERDSWPAAERDDGPEHIGSIIGEWMRLRGLDEQWREWQSRHGQPPVDEPALTHCVEG